MSGVDMSSKRQKQSGRRCKRVKQLKPPAFQVYLPAAARELIRRAVTIKKQTEPTNLSEFIGMAAVREAKQVIQEHALTVVREEQTA